MSNPVLLFQREIYDGGPETQPFFPSPTSPSRYGWFGGHMCSFVSFFFQTGFVNVAVFVVINPRSITQQLSADGALFFSAISWFIHNSACFLLFNPPQSLLEHLHIPAAFLSNPTFPFRHAKPLRFGHPASNLSPRFGSAFPPAFFRVLARTHSLLGCGDPGADPFQ